MSITDEINELPELIRQYIADLEQRADPAGDVRRAYVAEEKAQALERLVQELTDELDRTRSSLTHLREVWQQSQQSERLLRYALTGLSSEIGSRFGSDADMTKELRAHMVIARAALGQPQAHEVNLYYLQDSRQYVGNSILWWREGGAGYTTNLEEAGTFTAEKAFRQHRDRSSDRPWLKTYIDQHANRHVDHQKLKRPHDTQPQGEQKEKTNGPL
jgi:hypothetical protein